MTEIATVGVVGCGTMGSGICEIVARNGLDVTFVEVDGAAVEKGRARIEAGDATALLVVPAGFGDALLLEEPCELELVTNPAQTILPAIAEEAVAMLVEASFYLQRLFGPLLVELAGGPEGGAGTFPDETVASFAVRVNGVVQRLEALLFPPVLELEVGGEDAAGAGEDPAPSGTGALLFPGVLLLGLFFVAQGMADDLWVERLAGTLRRARCTPRPLWTFLAGKLLASAVLMAGIAAAGLLLGVWAFGLAFVNLPLALVWSVFGGTALLCLFQLLVVLASSQRGASLLTTVVLFPLVMLGGAFFPFEAMPGWMAELGALTPTGQSVLQLKAILRGDAEFGRLLTSAALLGLPALACLVLVERRLRGGFALP